MNKLSLSLSSVSTFKNPTPLSRFGVLKKSNILLPSSVVIENIALVFFLSFLRLISVIEISDLEL